MTVPCVQQATADVMAHSWGYAATSYEMPQTVPSAGYSPQCEYDFATDSFDLSLLPPAPTNASTTSYLSSDVDGEVPYSPTNLQQLMALLGDPTQSPPPMFSLHDTYGSPVKMEPTATVPTQPAQPEPMSVSGWENQPTFLSPMASPSYSFGVKQEDEDIEEQTPSGADGPGDHQLLREVLKDTSFQKKYNLKPFDIGNLAVGFVGEASVPKRPCKAEDSGDADSDFEQVDQDTIEPMLSLAIEQMRKDIDTTCSVLGISSDPTHWSSTDVRSWLTWTAQQFNLPPVDMNLFDFEGHELAALPEEELQRRDPQNGSLLFAQLEIWRTACATAMDSTPCPSTASSEAAPSPMASHQFHDEDHVMVATPESVMVNSPHSATASSASSADTSDDEDEDSSSTSPGAGSQCGNTASARGAHIHLWQFLKELLCAPHVHGSCVRWLDRPQGVFKIEDSVRVARLWGARKNRPAMNYDKLSRSIRQYYKKGIMRKTERSQRLVYQFCHPYCL